MVRVHLIPWSRRTIPSKSPGSLGSPGCALLALLRPVPPTLAPSLQRSRSVPRPCVLYVQACTPLVLLRTGDVAALGRCGHRQISTVTQFQAHPSGFLHWARGPCSRAAGGSLLTGAILKARSAGGVSGSFGRSVLKPKLLAGLLSFVPSPTLLHKFQVISKFPNRVHLIPWSRRTISSKSPGSLGFPGCALLALLRPVPPTLAPSLQRSRSVPRPCVLYVQSCTLLVLFRAGDVAALGRCGHRQISTVTQLQAHPSGFLHWARGPCSRAAGGSLLTCAILKARSAGGVSGSFGRSVLKPMLLAGLLSFVPNPTLLHKFQVISKFPNFQNTTAPYRCPHSLQK